MEEKGEYPCSKYLQIFIDNWLAYSNLFHSFFFLVPASVDSL